MGEPNHEVPVPLICLRSCGDRTGAAAAGRAAVASRNTVKMGRNERFMVWHDSHAGLQKCATVPLHHFAFDHQTTEANGDGIFLDVYATLESSRGLTPKDSEQRAERSVFIRVHPRLLTVVSFSPNARPIREDGQGTTTTMACMTGRPR